MRDGSRLDLGGRRREDWRIPASETSPGTSGRGDDLKKSRRKSQNRIEDQPAWLLSNPLDVVGVNIHQLGVLEQPLHLWPNAGEQRVEITSPQVAET